MTAFAQDGLFAVSPAAPKALTIRQPWASLIIAGLKDVENRGKPTSYRGTLLVHAGLAVDGDAMAAHGRLAAAYPAGAIIGAIDIVGCVQGHDSPWAIEGQWHWLLANPRTCDPVPARGALTLWRPEPCDLDAVLATLG